MRFLAMSLLTLKIRVAFKMRKLVFGPIMRDKRKLLAYLWVPDLQVNMIIVLIHEEDIKEIIPDYHL